MYEKMDFFTYEYGVGIFFSACGNSRGNDNGGGQEKQDSPRKEKSETPEENAPEQATGENGDSDTTIAENQESENVGTLGTDNQGSHVLIAYFTV